MRRFFFLPILLISSFVGAQVLMTGPGSYTQDFNSLANTGTGITWSDNVTVPNWYAQRTGTGTTYDASTGSSNAGRLYSFGATLDPDRALGSVGSGTVGNFAFGLQMQNTSGGSLGSFNVSYRMEQWRDGGATTPSPQSLTFWYQVTSAASTALTPNNNTGWTQVTALTGTSPVFVNTGTGAAVDGNTNFANLVNITIPGLVVGSNQYLLIKWEDPNHTGNDHGLSIDDVSISWTTSCITTSSISASICNSYTVPSGDETYTSSGTYFDTIPNAALCDSIITINLTILGNTTSTISPVACGSFTVPSGDETYTSSGTYFDTIPNFLGCDSIITINLTLTTSVTYYQDSDGDGLGNPLVIQTGCAPIAGYVTNNNDCDDSNNLVGAATTYYADSDNDGYGDASNPIIACSLGAGMASNNTDCNDNNSSINPGATEIPNNGIDEDCSGSDLVLAPSPLAIYEFTANDCSAPVWNVTAQPANATFSLYNVSGTQTCANAANALNFSGWNMTGAIVPTEYYGFTITPNSCYALNLSTLKFSHRASSGAPTVTVRSSLDNFQADLYTGTPTSTMTPITVALPAAFNAIYGPVEFRFYITTMATTGATYRHDNVSVEGIITALTTQTYFADADGDSFGDPAVTVTNCVPPAGYVTNNLDCNDNNAAEFPGAVWYQDNDNDGLGNPTVMLTQCTTPAGYVSNSNDCNDANNTIGAASTWYADADNDGFGDNAVIQTACTQPVGYVSNNTDCDDNDNAVGGAGITYYEDADSDGFGDPSSSTVACTAPTGFVLDNTDCDDTNPATYPGATEVCDGEDNNCDNNIDEGLPTFTWYQDADNDGRGNPTVTVTNCQQPAGYVGNSNDCDDTNPSPTAGQEIYYADVDGDNYGDPFNAVAACEAPVGYILQGGDCNDTVASINPSAVDTNGNGIDENCDGVDGYLSIADEVIGNVTILPNPGVNTLTVSFSQVAASYRIEVIAADGKILTSSEHASNEQKVTIPTESWMPGMYLVRVQMDAVAKTYRWIKQ